jgi:hypothetical protein
LGTLEREKKARYFTKLFGFALLFFLTVIALGQNKTKNMVFLTTEQKKRSCFKKFLRVLFSLFEVKLS